MCSSLRTGLPTPERKDEIPFVSRVVLQPYTAACWPICRHAQRRAAGKDPKRSAMVPVDLVVATR